MKTSIFIIILFLTLKISVFSRNTIPEGTQVMLKIHNGFILPHHQSIGYSLQDYITGFDIMAGKRFSDRFPEDAIFRFPVTGLGFYHSNLGNDHVFGHISSLYGFVEFPLRKPEKRLNFSYLIGFGGAYIDKKYSQENYLNTAIGSHFNIFIRFNGSLYYHITPRLSLKSGLNFTHASNGKLGTPNQGLNIITTDLGAVWNISPIQKAYPIPDKSSKYTRSNEREFFLSGGIKSPEDFVNIKFPIADFSATRYFQYTIKRKWGAGADIFYDASRKHLIENDTLYTFKNSDQFAWGIHGAHDFMYRRMAMTTQLGIYIFTRYIPITRTYFKLGFKYKITDHLTGMIAIKSHLAIADYIGWGIGYSIHKQDHE